MATATELAIDTGASALEMVQTIFGDGIQVVSATYTGDPNASGVYTGANTTMPGVTNSDSGVILSTGNAADFTNNSGTSDTNVNAGTGIDNAGVDGDAGMNGVSGQATFDGAILEASFIPTGDYLTMQFVFSSEEYPEYVLLNVNDSFAVWVNGQLVQATITASGNIAVDTVNQNQNQNLYQDNAADQFNTEMDGITYTLTFKAPVNPGDVNTIRIGIADGGDAVYDSNVLIAADSIQTVALAFEDTVQLTTNSTRTVDVLANDRDLQETGLTITHVMGQPIVVGQTVTIGTGEQVTLNADGTLTVTSDSDVGSNVITYSIVDGLGNTDIGFLTITTTLSPAIDGVVQGTTAGDLIDTSYLGDPDGDRVDTGDATGVYGTVGEDDYILAGAGDDTVLAGAGNDSVFAAAGNDSVEGGAGNDQIMSGDGADTVFGGAGDDAVHLEAGNDVFGTFGPDSEGNDTVYGGSGNDSIIGGDGDDRTYGGSGDDTVTGSIGSDTLYGGDDQDTFYMTEDHQYDSIDGGEGGSDFDTVWFGNFVQTSGVRVTLTASETATYDYFTTDGAGAFSNIEAIGLTGFDDSLDGSAADGSVTVYGLDGDDTITGGAGQDDIIGGLGNDVITGNVGSDSLEGGDGNDTINAGPEAPIFAEFTTLGGTAQTLTGTNGNGDFDHTLTTDGPSVDTATVVLEGGLSLDGYHVGNGPDANETHTHSFTQPVAGVSLTLANIDTTETVVIWLDGVAINLNDAIASGLVSFDPGTTGFFIDASGAIAASTAPVTEPFPAVLIINQPLTTLGVQNVSGTGAGDGTVYSVDVNTNPALASALDDDTVAAGAGDDVVTTGAGNDAVDAGTGNDAVDGGIGDDAVDGGDGNDALLGGEGADSLLGGLGDDTIDGGADADQIDGGAGNDSLLGGSENDTIFGGAGQDSLLGGDGDDSLTDLDGAGDVRGGAGNDSIATGAANDLASGDAGEDLLNAGAGNDTVLGGSGEDTLTGGAGADLLDGDAIAFDPAAYASGVATGPATISFTNTSDTSVTLYHVDAAGTLVVAGIAAPGAALNIATSDNQTYVAFDTLTNQPLEVYPTTYDGLALSYDGGADLLDGGTGNDTLTGGAGADTLLGGDDRDTFNGTSLDVVDGGEGGDDRDTLVVNDVASVAYGGGNNEAGTITFNDASTLTFSNIETLIVDGVPVVLTDGIVHGTAGDDTMGIGFVDAQGDIIDGADGDDDTILADAGNDLVDAGVGTDSVEGGAGNDTLSGGGDEDTLYGGAGADSLSGGGEIDQIYGGEDNDTIDGNENNDFVYGGAGDDLITDDGTSLSDDSLYGGDGNDQISGGAREDLIFGDAGNDDLGGDAGDDVISGGSGDDTLSGGTGNDSLSGDDGNDLVQGDTGNDTLTGGAGQDTLSGGDDRDTFNGAALDVVDGGEGGDDLDTLIVNNVLSVAYGGGNNEAGTVTFNDATTLTFLNIETLIVDGVTAVPPDGIVNGTAGDDIMGIGSVDAQGDIIDGADGDNDTILAADGNDSVAAGAGNDSLEGGAGNDTLAGGAGDNLVSGGVGDDVMVAGAGADTFDGGSGQDNLDVSAATTGVNIDLFSGVMSGDLVGDDFLAFGVDGVIGSDFDDTLSGFDEFDATYTNLLYGGGGNDQLDGRGGDDRLEGGTGNDLLTGGLGSDQIFGGDDADRILGGSGDTVAGGEGGNDNDVLQLDFATVQAIAYGGGDNESGTVTFADGGTLTFTEIESIAATGETPDGIIWGTSTRDLIGAGYIDANGDITDNNDAILSNPGSDDDEIYALEGNDTIQSLLGDDRAYGGTGDDLVQTGVGNDYAQGDEGNDTVEGEEGDDFLRGDAGNDSVYGGIGNDSVYGGLGNDQVFGGDGDDQVFGGFDDDTVYGGGGNDTITGSGEADLVYGDGGNDFMQGSNGADTLYGGVGDDTMLGEEDADTFYAGSGDYVDGYESVTTGTDNDTLYVTDVQSVALDPGNDENGVVTFNDGSTLQFFNIERLFVDGVLLGGPDYIVEGTTGDDVIDAAYAGDPEGDLVDASDNATGTNDDLIEAYGGNDAVAAGAGNDTVYAGADDDTVQGGAGDDVILGEAGNDSLDGGAGADFFYGGLGDDRFVLTDGFGADDVAGGEAGQVTGDLLDGSALTGDTVLDLSTTGAGNPEDGTLTSGSDTLMFREIERITLGSGDDSVIGSSGGDVVATGAGADTVNGGAGNDRFLLGAADAAVDLVVLQDGAGQDVIGQFEAPTDNGGGTFSGQDQLDVSALLDLGGQPVNVADVVVTDTNGDGTGDAILTFPDGTSVTLTGVTPPATGTNAWLEAMGIPGLGLDYIVEGTGGDDSVDAAYTGDPEGDRVDAADNLASNNDDVIETYGGNDSVSAGDGNDLIDGGAGNDWLQGDEGNDTIHGGDGNDAIFSVNGQDVVYGGDGDDTAFASQDGDLVYGGAGNDSLLGGGFAATGHDTLYGGSGADTLTGGLGNDVLYGGDEADLLLVMTDLDNDTIAGGEGGSDVDVLDLSGVTAAGVDATFSANEAGTVSDGSGVTVFSEIEQLVLTGLDDSVDGTLTTQGLFVDAGGGDDTVLAGSGADTLSMGAGDDVVNAGAGNDRIGGAAGNDTVQAGAGDDTVYGEDGDDSVALVHGFGSDVIEGGEATESTGDVLDLSGLSMGATVDLTSANAETGSVSDGLDTASFIEIERIVLGGGVDTLVLGDGSGDDRVEGFAAPVDNGDGSFTGVDQLDVTGLTDAGGALVNTADVVVSDDGNGNAVLTFPNGESLTLLGVSPAAVTDPLALAAMGIPIAPDYVVEGSGGDDIIDGTYLGDPEGDRVDASDNATGTNDDLIEAYGGADSVVAGDGDDTVYAGSGNDTVVGGDGQDQLSGEAGNDLLTGGLGRDTLTGGTGDDQLRAGGDDDTLTGGTGNDLFMVESGGGTDEVAGGEDAGDGDIDVLDRTGGTGGETLVIFSGDEAGTLNADDGSTVTFSGIERIVLDEGRDSIEGGNSTGGIDVSTGVGNDAALGGSGADTFNMGDGEDRVQGDAGNDLINLGLADGDRDTLHFLNGFGEDVVVGFEVPVDNGDGTFTGRDVFEVSALLDATGNPVNTADVVVSSNVNGDAVLTFPMGETITLVGVLATTVTDPLVLAAMGIPIAPDYLVEGSAGDDVIDGTYLGDPEGDRIDTADNQTGANGDLIEAYGGNDSVLAGDGNDTAYGGAGDDTMLGGAGDDSLLGEDGNDSLLGDDGNDSLDGGAGNDTIFGGAGNDSVVDGEGDDVVDGGDGDDFLDGPGNDTYFGGSGNDTINAGTGNDLVYGGIDNDSLSGEAGNDSIYGDAGNDQLFGGAGTDLVDGGAGNDNFIGGAGNDTSYGGSGDDSMGVGDTGDDLVYGGLGNDVLSGDLGNDTIFGDEGNDAIEGHDGADTLYGGAGSDYIAGFDVTGITSPVNRTLNPAGFDDGSNDLLEGGDGNDTLLGGLGNDTLFGGADADTLLGSGGADSLAGDAGNDSLAGGLGDDSLSGGANDDTLQGDAGNDQLDGGDGDDQLEGGDGNDLLTGGLGNDYFEGDAGDDSLYGGDGNDALNGGTGNDLVYAGAGNDGIDAGDGNDTVYGGDGIDDVRGSQGDDLLYGGDGNDRVLGNSENDTLFGDLGDDTIEGGTGNDSLTGGAGADTMSGDDDRDTFRVDIGDVVDGGEGGDDFDTLDLRGSGNVNVVYDGGNPENGTVEFLDAGGAVLGTMTFSNIENVMVPCFTPGTLIVTDKGEMRVEDLTEGVRVLTRENGYQAVRWIGRKDLSANDLTANPHLLPVRIAKGALGTNVPEHDLIVSPQHRMLISGSRAELLIGEHEVLVVAAHMAGVPGVTTVEPEAGVSYLHLLLDRHEIIRANGAWTESYQPGDMTLAGLDDATRREVLELFPELMLGFLFPAARLTLKKHEAKLLFGR